jgi:hypothetical protein
MARYKTVPFELEVVQWDGNKVSETTKWIKEGLENFTLFRQGNQILVETLAGQIICGPMDYLALLPNGSIIPLLQQFINDNLELIE